ncbi:MAG: Gfo/Idh/MocA family oxidoreductase [Anaerolineae bacterium]|nr:Gfo/Idh/MocA family oxidoreductase [Anaerolineae bacterium]
MASEGKQARIGFIGCGRHATRTLYPNLPLIDEIDLVAVADLQVALAERNARRFGARRFYDSADALLEGEPDLDGVIVVGIPQMMQPIGEKVLRERGIPIFVEKPPAINAERAEEFAARAAEAGTWGMVGFMKRFSVAYGLAKQTAEDPSFGPISMLDGKFANGDYNPLWGIESGGLSYLTGQAVHIFDLIQYFAGPVGEVYARYFERSPANHGFAVTVTFESGALASLNLNSFESWEGFDEWFCITGVHNYVVVEDMLYVNVHREKGWTEMPAEMQLDNLSLAYKPTAIRVPDMRNLMGYTGELREFARCILEGRRPGPDLEAGAAAMRVGQAIWDSSQSGRAIRLA